MDMQGMISNALVVSLSTFERSTISRRPLSHKSRLLPRCCRRSCALRHWPIGCVNTGVLRVYNPGLRNLRESQEYVYSPTQLYLPIIRAKHSECVPYSLLVTSQHWRLTRSSTG